MRILSTLLCLAVLLALVPGCGGRRGPGSATPETEHRDPTDRAELLGTRRVDFKADHDTISVGAHDGTFEALRIDVEGSALEMWDVKITYGNGDKHSPATRLIFGENSWSRRIDLPGGNRVIKRIDFVYKSRTARTGKATVKVYGIH